MSAPGGYRVCAADLARIGEKYLCSSCGFVVRMAVQVAECGHMYCEKCMDEIKRQNHPACVKCGISLELQTQVFADKFVRREIENVKVNCTNVTAGCEWSGNLRFLEEHQCECPLRPLCCGKNGCSQEVPACHMELHQQQECGYRLVMCPQCNSAETVRHLEAHLEICPAFPVSCPNCGIDNIPRSQLCRHNDPVNGDCTRNICPFRSLGCTCAELMSREDLMKHLVENLNSHFLFLASVFKNSNQKDTPAGIRQELQSAEAEIVAAHSWALSTQNRRLGALDDEVKRLVDTLMAATARSEQVQMRQTREISGLQRQVARQDEEIGSLQRQVARQDEKIDSLLQLMRAQWR